LGVAEKKKRYEGEIGKAISNGRTGEGTIEKRKPNYVKKRKKKTPDHAFEDIMKKMVRSAAREGAEQHKWGEKSKALNT